MKTNDIKKGVRVRLRNGWEAIVADNAKGTIRMCEVFGDFTEIGSVYAHDIVQYQAADKSWMDVEHTPAQEKLRKQTQVLGL